MEYVFGMRLFAHILMGCLLLATGVLADTPSFDRYRIILERKPFGDAPPQSEAPPAPLIPPSESFAKTIRLSAIYEVEGGGIRVGLVDLQKNDSFFLGVGEVQEGIELISANFEDEEAVLKRGAEMAIIKLQSGEIQAITAQEHEKRVQARATSYADRRRMRAERPPPEPPPEPTLTGAALEKHLQEYQMEVIRQGLPPLPIPLTPEMDQQLINEGILPPQ